MSHFELPRDRFRENASHVNGRRRFHQIRTVRLRERLSLKSASRRLSLTMSDLRDSEDETNDIRLSTLYAWQSVLSVPVSELVIDADVALSEPIRQRACLLRIAKTANTIRKKSHDESMRALADTLITQLAEIVPEVNEIGTWPDGRKSRSSSDLGKVANWIAHDPFDTNLAWHDTMDPP